MPTAGRTSALAFVVLALVLVTRLLYIGFLHHKPIEGDEVAYDTLARSLVAGKGYSYPPELLYPWQIDGSGRNLPTARRPPLYPVLLAGGYRFGLDHDGIRVVQALLATLTVWLVYRTALEIGVGERAAIFAMLALTVYRPFLSTTGAIATEALFLPLVAATALWFLRGLAGLRWRDFVLSGLALGLANLTRPVSYLFPAVLMAFALVRSRRAALGTVVLVAAMALAVSPWVARNAMVFGEFEPSFTHTGFNFYMGTLDSQLSARFPVEMEARIQGLNEFQCDSVYRVAGVENIRRDPARFVALMGLKALSSWFSIDPTVSWMPTRNSLVINGLGLIATLLGFVLLARSRLALRWFPIAAAGYFFAIQLLSVAGLRFSLPMILFCTIGIGVCADRLLPGRKPGAN